MAETTQQDIENVKSQAEQVESDAQDLIDAVWELGAPASEQLLGAVMTAIHNVQDYLHAFTADQAVPVAERKGDMR
jgi:hypothetical protein